MKRGGEHGFTLIELLVILALLSLLLTLAPGVFERLVPTLRYRAMISDVGATLREARLVAIRESRTTQVLIDLDRRVYAMVGAPQGRLAGRIEDDLDLKLRIGEGEQTEAGAGRIRFFPDGSSTGGRIVFARDGGGGHRISVDWLTGRTSVHDLKAGG